jgi:hypothetical protein
MISRETALAFSDEFQKISKAGAKARTGDDIEGDDPGPGSRLGRTIASNALGLAAGTAAGYGTGKLIELGARKAKIPVGAVWPKVMTGATTAMGLAIPLWRMQEQKVMSGQER